jgi:hypothetical protein
MPASTQSAPAPATKSTRPGYLVKSPCGRAWFVPLEKVGEDYADFLRQADGLSPEEAKKKSDENRDFWPTWFAEQCNLWGDIERLGTLVTKSTLFKTKAALDRRRGRLVDGIDDYTEVTA